MTERQEKTAIATGLGLAGLLVWWMWPGRLSSTSAGAAVTKRRLSEYVIDDNVMSPDFGLPVYGPPAPARDVADNPEMRRLIDASNAAIAADDALNKG